MTVADRVLASRLTYAGILPPWLGLGLAPLLGVPEVGFGVLIYGAVIASFVCGMHWGFYMNASGALPVQLLLTSNIGALLAWVLVLVSIWSMPIAIVGLVLVLAGLLEIDRRLLSAKAIEPWFWLLRRNASLGLGIGLLIWTVAG
jgi:hypothetical protein